MARLIELQGYSLVLDKVVFVTRLFESANGEGVQFNVALVGDRRLQLKYPDRGQATLERELLIKALREM